MKQRLIAALLAVSFVWPLTGHAAADADTAMTFIRNVGHDMPKVLAGATTIDEKRARLEPFLARVVDVPAVARFCLGRYWAQATPQQQLEYQNLFLEVLANSIATWGGDYGKAGSTQTAFAMQTPVVQTDGTYVPTTVQSGTAPAAHITWVLNMTTTPPKILDVTAEGMSLRVTQRSDYVAYLSHHDGNIDAFIQVLRQRSHDRAGNPFASSPAGIARAP